MQFSVAHPNPGKRSAENFTKISRQISRHLWQRKTEKNFTSALLQGSCSENPPPPKTRNFMDMEVFPAGKNTEILGAHKIGAAISGPRIAGANILRTLCTMKKLFVIKPDGLLFAGSLLPPPKFCCENCPFVERQHQAPNPKNPS